MKRTRLAGVVASFAVTGLVLAGCEAAEDADPTADDPEQEEVEPEDDPDDDPDDEADDEAAPDEEFGPACDAIPDDPDDPGSLEGMQEAPVGDAAASNPAVSTLVEAVMAAGLVDDLNGLENATVFAPANEAFEEIPEEDLNALLEDEEALTEVLTYHVIPEERAEAADLEDGEFESLQGGTVTTEGSGEEFTIDGTADVACGNVQTANATVHIIDGVLMPDGAEE